MAPIDIHSLSSNWKKLQQTLQSSKPADKKKETSTLKRKRSSATLDAKPSHKKTTTKTSSRKRLKMEEPPSVGASLKHHDLKSLARSVSTPNLRHPSVLSDPKATSDSISVLAPSPDHPDIENEGLSSTAMAGKFLALDCEMVGTGPEPDRDSALARVSVVNFHGHQIYDSYVQVKVPVTDYRTAVSGIEPHHLRKDYARTFKEVHEDIKILLQGRILVGHAVKNDLDALMLKHEKRYIRDTSQFSKFRELASIPGRTPRLKTLVEKLLGVEIQVGAHSSVEDARATMALYRLEKPRFEEEIMRIRGPVRGMGETQAGGDAVGESDVQRSSGNKNRKKKKKKGKH
ncbi:RNA exonuclease 4 [Sporormia fimetaria CBS 119925]|uniref:RNA exonuclease 4 n=1 Tax=Sporormia fimetaria CBS 119925 TaxID=1340428 RepID=A0A6A6VMX3_9PLEO|nr:RNA exonuclease 4 [Sporormia fimetaria CBS 119925]